MCCVKYGKMIQVRLFVCLCAQVSTLADSQLANASESSSDEDDSSEGGEAGGGTHKVRGTCMPTRTSSVGCDHCFIAPTTGACA